MGAAMLDSGQAEGRFQATDLPKEFRYKSGISGKTPLRCQKVNEVTWKITNGEQVNTPTCHGKWSGYRTTKAVACVINIAPGQWLARYHGAASGPSSFNEAKASALAMARGAHGDYFVENPIDHLNGLQARLLDGKAA
jgi:hypothetical protein